MVQQLGTPDVLSPDTSPLLTSGAVYLLFLNVEPGNAPGHYVITGDDGVYQLTQPGNTWTYAGGPGGELPHTLDLASIFTLVRAPS